MGKREKKTQEERVKRRFAVAQADLQLAQEKRTAAIAQGDREIEEARQRAARRVAKATERVERRAADLAQMEAELLALREQHER